MAGPKITVPNLSRIRATADSTVGDALQQMTEYIGKNTTPAAGTRRAAPNANTHPVIPKTP